MKELRPEEAWARDMVERALGLPVCQHDDGSAPGMYDLNIDPNPQTGVPRAIVEITSSIDADFTRTWKALNGADDVLTIDGIEGGWLVTTLPLPPLKRLLAELPRLLLDAEGAGITERDFDDTEEASTDELSRRGGDLRIASILKLQTKVPGRVYFTVETLAERSGGAVPADGNALADWIGEFLAAPKQRDVLAKRRGHGASERHAFVLVPGVTSAPWPVPYVMTTDPMLLPVTSPRLPEEVTSVWIAGTWSSSGVRWSSQTRWQRFSTVPSASGRAR
jgi:hypothetical protein